MSTTMLRKPIKADDVDRRNVLAFRFKRVRTRVGHTVQASVLYAAYCAWCSENGFEVRSSSFFGRTICDKDQLGEARLRKRPSNNILYTNIELIELDVMYQEARLIAELTELFERGGVQLLAKWFRPRPHVNQTLQFILENASSLDEDSDDDFDDENWE